MRTPYPFLLLLLLAGCASGPNYRRPSVPVPPQFPNAPAAAASLADTKWPDLFGDDILKQLISHALENNFDLGIASERVLEARARYRVTGAEQYPYLGAQAQFAASRPSSVGASTLARPEIGRASCRARV